MIAGIAGVVVAGVVAALILSQPEDKPAEVQTTEPERELEPELDQPKFDYGKYGLQIDNLRATRKKNPCAKRVAIDLGEKLNAAGDYHGAILLVDEFHKECGTYPRLLWVKVYAHEQLGQWSEAAELSTQLIADKPYDSDFWWWRGKAHAEGGNELQAKADFRQSIAAKPNKFAAARYAQYFGDHDPCEAAFALSFYAEQRPEQQATWATRDAERLYLAGDCDRLAGRGTTSIRFKDGAPIIKTRAKVNGRTGTFVVSDQSAYVTMSRAFADKAGVEMSSDSATIYLAEAHHTATLASADITAGRASAASVAIAVAGEMPGDIDGILGVSFLWRFAYDRMPGELSLTSRTGN